MPRAGGEPGTTSVGPGIQTDMPSENFDENLNYLLLKKNFYDSVDGDIYDDHHQFNFNLNAIVSLATGILSSTKGRPPVESGIGGHGV